MGDWKMIDSMIVDGLWDVYNQYHMGTTAENVAKACLLYTSDAADERSSVDLGGRRIIKKKKKSQPR